MRTYTLRLTIEDELTAQNIDEAWEKFRQRIESRFYGPTKKDIEEGYEIDQPPQATY